MKKFIKINLIILVIFCLSTNLPLKIVFATEEIVNEEENNVEEEEKTLDDLELEKSELNEQIEMSNSQIGFIEEDLTKTVAEIAEINQNILDKRIEISTLEVQEENLNAYIERAEIELEKSTEKYEKQKKLLERRLVAMYEMGQTSYLDVLLNSNGIIDFLSNYYMITEIANADNELLEEVAAEKEYNEKLKEVLDEKQETLLDNRKNKKNYEVLLENMSILKNSKLQELTESEIELQKQVEEFQNQVAAIETEIRVLALKNVSERYVGGEMAWPVPGYTKITSPYGMRTHPITGVFKLHTGVDIGAPMGTNFIAANDGVVTYAGWNNAYGKMVIIDHGGGISTLYAHGSEILVQVGDTVYQGTPILKVGSTGYSTGPHAHFEVRVGGVCTEPLEYITSYSSAKPAVEQNKTAESKNNTNTNNTNTNTSKIQNAVEENKNEAQNNLNEVTNISEDNEEIVVELKN